MVKSTTGNIDKYEINPPDEGDHSQIKPLEYAKDTIINMYVQKNGRMSHRYGPGSESLDKYNEVQEGNKIKLGSGKKKLVFDTLRTFFELGVTA